MNTLPPIPNHTWRPLTVEDAAALAQFELACAPLDGATKLRSVDRWRSILANGDHPSANSIGAVDPAGWFAAVGWLDYLPGAKEATAFLDGRVHPDWRGMGIGSALLGWMEAQARIHLAATAGEQPQVLRIMFYDRADDAVTLFQEQGYRFMYVEEELACDLHQPLPKHRFPGDLRVEAWSQENAHLFHPVYADAFSTRTRTPLDREAWTRYWANPEDSQFHPELSFLVMAGDQPVAFVVASIDDQEDPEIAWVDQFGVRPAWRRQGIGAALLAETLRHMAAAGYRQGMLRVNVDNPGARRFYEHVGLKLVRKFTMYRKEIDP